MSEHENWQELAASYALDALDAPDRAAFESHLADCVACRADVQAYREAAGMLAHAAPVRTPPPHLRDTILARVRESGARTPPGGWSRDAAAGRAAHEKARPGLMPRWRPLALAASIILAVGALLLFALERSRAAGLEQQLAALESELGTSRAQIAALDSTIAKRDSLFAAVFGPDVTVARLVSQGQPPSAQLYWNRARNTIVIAAQDLPPAPAGRTYQLWGITPGTDPVSLGTFDSESSGRAVAIFRLPAGTQFRTGAVTEEPAGGSPQPTTNPFLIGAL